MFAAFSKLELYLIGGAALVAAFGVWLLVHDAKVESRAASKTISKIDKVNSNATSLGKRGAAGTADRRVLGQRDPTTRDD